MQEKILIANRGEIALRIIRACKELGITSAVVYTPADKDSLPVKMADEAYPLKENKSYLNIEEIINTALKNQVTAIHPGYGFLAENSKFAKSCLDAGIKFIGPSAKAIELMGDKAVAREIMKKAGVPVIPGSDGEIDDFREALKVADEIGYPVIVKAAGGGGGRGMRIVHTPKELEEAIQSAAREAASTFGNSKLYLEKYLQDCRHVEFQILADQYGNAVYLGERDCSLQRRNQKVIEEGPCHVLTERMRKKMGELAVRSAMAVHYAGAGTVEFLLDDRGNFYFIEMNTRIQVEHPVTEMITGIDIVKEQIKIGLGERLSITQKDVKIYGHAIECRVNAEDPISFIPTPGEIKKLMLPQGPFVRVDTAVYEGYTIPPYYDSMIAKLIVWGRNREEAIIRMKRALEEFVIGGVTTNLPFLRKVMDNAFYRRGEVYTNFIKRRMEPLTEEDLETYRDKQIFGAEGEQEQPLEEIIAAVAAAFAADQTSKKETREQYLTLSPWKIGGLLEQMQRRLFRGGV
ncbi:acetyl-CoA carboxylase biotin carboxylase subunit [Carboxydothermus ferrireducens]|uniref:Biotin carboxylase n=1 Tax=Carboxydothermus ferrireducens DSM 11255 TaxID=1119529 RepID=A0ABX2R6N0_9THEO|nr:acetyl-CoA carboxylase biotin carboxylase subunit [Carboxydothermus ferrireducens]NYE56823.1 acetyl-CoA carboxylase biotin carboxylase subunit [Carboxydothermus ferrireducens DSM 11255]